MRHALAKDNPPWEVPRGTTTHDGKGDFSWKTSRNVLESDIVDIGSYNEADTHARIAAFIETLKAAKG